jgi:hypothetical protein
MLLKLLGLGAVAMVLAACALPANLNEDGYDAKKYHLPPVLHAGATKTISVTAGEGWAFIPVTQGTYYEVSATGPSAATLTIYHADKTTVYVSGSTATAQGFIAAASEDAFVKISVSGQGAASYDVVCAGYSVLTSGVWQNGQDGTSPAVYVFPVTGGKLYDFNLNNRYDGDGTKTSFCAVTIYHHDLVTSWFSAVDAAYTSPVTFSATNSETAFVNVSGAYGNPGTFAIRLQETPVTAMSSGVWLNDNVVFHSIRWYSFPVTAGVLYGLRINDSVTGDGTKTSRAVATIYHDDLKNTYVSQAEDDYGIPDQFAPVTAGTAYIAMAPFSGDSGTFAMVLDALPVTVLNSGIWQNGTATAASNRLWYSFVADGSSTYTFRMNSIGDGDGTKTAFTEAFIYGSDGRTHLSGELYGYGTYTGGFMFTPPAGKVFVCVTTDVSSIGTFAVKYQ